MLYQDKPDLSDYGLREARLVYPSELWDEGNPDEPDQAAIEAAAAAVLGEGVTGPTPVVLDVEHWALDVRLDSEEEVAANREKMRQVLAFFKAAAPSLSVGFYAFSPIRDYWTPVLGVPADIVAWKAANDFLQTLADDQDSLHPSLYAFYDDEGGWVKYAQANLAEAQRLAKGKPIVPFIWPQLHTEDLTGAFLSAQYWTLVLETVRRAGCAGAIIWGPPNVPWDAGRPWWQATLAFLEGI